MSEMPPFAGILKLNVAGGPPVVVTTTKLAGLLAPFSVVTVTLRAPAAAVEAIANVAVIDVPLTTFTPDTVTSAPAEMVAPAAKFAPISVTGTELPGLPEFGLMLVRMGVAGPTTLKGWVPLV